MDQAGSGKRRLYVDMDNVLVDFQSGIDRLDPQARLEYVDRYDEAPGIFALMDPTPGAIESFRELAGLFDTYILSTAPWENPSAWSDKLEWVRRHIGSTEGTAAYKRLILSHHKNLLTGDFIVDDRTARGVDQFDGEHVHFGTAQFPDWPSVLEYLRLRAEQRVVDGPRASAVEVLEHACVSALDTGVGRSCSGTEPSRGRACPSNPQRGLWPSGPQSRSPSRRSRHESIA